MFINHKNKKKREKNKKALLIYAQILFSFFRKGACREKSLKIRIKIMRIIIYTYSFRCYLTSGGFSFDGRVSLFFRRISTNGTKRRAE